MITAEVIEEQMKAYALEFLKANYGEGSLKKLELLDIIAVDAYDVGGTSEATDSHIQIAAKRDINAGRLTGTTKLILRHELGHFLDGDAPMFPEFDEEIEHEKKAWKLAKPRNAAEHWYQNVSVRTHVDPLKMQARGFPRPELKITLRLLKRGTRMEVKRMRQDSVFVDGVLAERFAMVNLLLNPDFYH